MTLPDERYRALVRAEAFMIKLCNTPRVPKEVKEEAKSVLRHFPSKYDVNRLAEKSPDILSEESPYGRF
jgi:hypothetical protein